MSREIEEILENHVDAVMDTSILAISPFDGYKGITDEEKIDKAREKDYNKAVSETKKELLQWHKEEVERILDELEMGEVKCPYMFREPEHREGWEECAEDINQKIKKFREEYE